MHEATSSCLVLLHTVLVWLGYAYARYHPPSDPSTAMMAVHVQANYLLMNLSVSYHLTLTYASSCMSVNELHLAQIEQTAVMLYL